MATAAEVQIMNTALGLLGQEPVPDLADATLEQSNAATKLLRHMHVARDVVLARHGWTCALQYRVLAPEILAGYVNFRYPTTYGLPGDALRVWEIAGEVFNGEATCWAPRWQVGTWQTAAGARLIVRALHATDSLSVAYVRRANWASLDINLADGIAHELAARGAYSVSGDRALARDVAQRAEARILLAISAEGTQEGGQPELAPSIPAMIRGMSR